MPWSELDIMYALFILKANSFFFEETIDLVKEESWICDHAYLYYRDIFSDRRTYELDNSLYSIIENTMWMARRYADGRSTYAPTDFNNAVHLLDELGLQDLLREDNGERFANDGGFGKYNPTLRKFEKEG